MKRYMGMAVGAVAGVVLMGCATPISTMQKSELQAYQAKGLAVEEKNPSLAAGLGILPGFGSFYTRNYGVGIVNLLFWPLSVLWDPISGYDGAVSINYYTTKTSVQAAQTREMRALDQAFEDGRLARDQYIRARREVEAKYSGDLQVVAAPLLNAGVPAPVAVPAADTPPPVVAPAPVAAAAAVPAAMPAAAASALQAGSARTSQSLPLLKQPRGQGDVASIIPQGAALELQARQVNGEGAWWFAQYEGAHGWVSEQSLTQ